MILLLACASPEDSADVWADPSEPGPWTVGTYEDEIVGRTGVELSVQVWYPTEVSDGGLHK